MKQKNDESSGEYCKDCEHYVPIDDQMGDCSRFPNRRCAVYSTCPEPAEPIEPTDYTDPMMSLAKDIGMIIGSLTALAVIVTIIRSLF